jgi:hypothetical protein
MDARILGGGQKMVGLRLKRFCELLGLHGVPDNRMGPAAASHARHSCRVLG